METTSLNLVTWTLGVQLGSAGLITLFFLAFSRTVQRVEVKLWLLAWLSETAAAAAAFSFTLLTPDPISAIATWELRALLFVFATAKTLFALFIVRGLRRHFRPKETLRFRIRHSVLFALFWGLFLALIVPGPLSLLPAQWLLVSMVLVGGGGVVLRQNPGRGLVLLPAVVLAAGLLYFLYVPLTMPLVWGAQPLTELFHHSSLFDAVANVVLALVLLMAIERSRSARLEEINHRLQNSYDGLRKLADVDPLTGLYNRRKLREILSEAENGALISLDLDGFKNINDTYGHDVGDSCLTWTARTLHRAFRPTDHLFRLGSDEFLVVAPTLDEGRAHDRMAAVQLIVGEGTAIRPPVRVSYGVAMLSEGRKPEQALREADRRMHEHRQESGARG